MLYIQIEEVTKQITGYSSTRMSKEDIKVDIKNLDERFFNMPMFYNFVDGQIVFDAERFNLYKVRKANRLSDEQRLGQQMSNIEIQMMMLQQMLLK